MTKSSLGGNGGYVMDYLGFIYHGSTVTHIDALCHIWDEDGMWQGRDPDVEITTQGAHFADITHWNRGVITKGVLIDVPRHRGEPHVTADRPVRGDEIEEIAAAQGVTVEPGDALLVHSGWESYTQSGDDGSGGRPGLHPSCAEFIRDHDVALLGWDLMDARMGAADLPWPVARGAVQLRRRPARQRAAGAHCRRLRRGGPARVHVHAAAAERRQGHRQPRQPDRDVLTGTRRRPGGPGPPAMAGRGPAPPGVQV